MRRILVAVLRALRGLAGRRGHPPAEFIAGADDELGRLLLERARLKETVSLFRSFGFEALAREYNQSLGAINRKIRALRRERGYPADERVTSVTN